MDEDSHNVCSVYYFQSQYDTTQPFHILFLFFYHLSVCLFSTLMAARFEFVHLFTQQSHTERHGGAKPVLGAQDVPVHKADGTLALRELPFWHVIHPLTQEQLGSFLLLLLDTKWKDLLPPERVSSLLFK